METSDSLVFLKNYYEGSIGSKLSAMEIGTDVALGTAALGGVGLAMVRDGRHRIVGATLAALGIPISWCLVKRTQTMAREVEFEAVQLAAIRQELGVQQVISLDLE